MFHMNIAGRKIKGLIKVVTLFMLTILLIVDLSWSEEIVRINGSTTMLKKIMEPGRAALEQATGIKLVLTGNGSGSGLADLINGRCDAAMASESLADAILSNKGISKTETNTDFKTHIISTDDIRVIVNPSNPVKKLSKKQLKDLLTGNITNWKEVGGADVPVVVVISNNLGSGTRRMLQKIVMDEEPYARDTVLVTDKSSKLEMIEVTPGGISAVSEAFIISTGHKEEVSVVETMEISRPLIVITKGEPSINVRKVIDFFSDKGSIYIKK